MFFARDLGFQVLRMADVDRRAENINKASQTLVDDLAIHTAVHLSSNPSYVSLSSDNTTVSVCVKEQQINIVHLYDIHGFKSPVISRRMCFAIFICI